MRLTMPNLRKTGGWRRCFHLLCILGLSLSACALKPGKLPMISLSDLPLSSDALQKSRLPSSTQGQNSYLGINLDVTPYAALTKHIEKIENVELKSRGEAHITVITPPEMQILTKKLKPAQIQELAEQEQLQKAPFKALCAGKGQVGSDKTYFVVVGSEKIFQFRSDLQKLFEKKGGDKNAFQAEHYYPHVTLGFTSRDLHEHEGVVKDERSCFYVFDEGTEELLSSKNR